MGCQGWDPLVVCRAGALPTVRSLRPPNTFKNLSLLIDDHPLLCFYNVPQGRCSETRQTERRATGESPVGRALALNVAERG